MKRDRIGAIGRYVLAALMSEALYLSTGSQWVLGLLVFILLIPVVSLALNLYVRRKIQAKILLATTAAKGTACTGSVQLENKAWLPAAKLYCKVGLINDLTREENTLELICALGAGKDHRWDFLMESAYCGRVYVYVQSLDLPEFRKRTSNTCG